MANGQVRVPRIGHCFRYVGPGPANGILQRVVLADAHQVVSVQEASAPRFSWSGALDEFWSQFVFITGPAPSAFRRF
jgi:hypothetical protein